MLKYTFDEFTFYHLYTVLKEYQEHLEVLINECDNVDEIERLLDIWEETEICKKALVKVVSGMRRS